MTNRIFLSILCISIVSFSCQTEIQKETEIYFNDFEAGELTNIDRGHFIDFDGSQVLGNFNNSGFNLTLNDIAPHNYLVVSMDLYIHDSWDGNTNELNPPGDDQDFWILEFDPGIPRKATDDIFFQTTFSNGPCISYWCLTQSYPNIYPFVNDPKTGAARSLSGLCLLRDAPDGTTHYRFEKWFRHERGSVVISMYDRLLQTNASDPKCDESWSLDNLRIRIATVD